MTEEELAIRAMPHPGREGSAEITARLLLNHEMVMILHYIEMQHLL